MNEQIDLSKTLSAEEEDAKNVFFEALNLYSTSNEMITTWLGRDPQEGGKILISWNTLNRLFWKYVAISKGIEKVPDELRALMKSQYQNGFKVVNNHNDPNS